MHQINVVYVQLMILWQMKNVILKLLFWGELADKNQEGFACSPLLSFSELTIC